MQHKERHEIDQPVQHASIQQYTIIYTIYLLLFRHACNQTPKSILIKTLRKKYCLTAPYALHCIRNILLFFSFCRYPRIPDKII